MKLLLVLCFSMFASAAMACTDFSGNYRNGEGVQTQIQQSGCTSVTFSNVEGTGTIITDGQFRVLQDDADVRILTSAAFVGATLNLEGKFEYKQPAPPEMPSEYIAKRFSMVYTKSNSGDVVAVMSVYNSQNQVIYSLTDSYSKL
ncbi:hypothetical protein SHI21_10175 [Bacteriovorax sp. PP10]|uniref:Lipoprotein n=1 Tax=Bacteriovorax antarcticus TaxID=3088717 RepID=A0ABU5VW16_9BACT|nr:hypothetical protein [Bacteriovorax sp. PP10]MEA9356573.1 hypothetical protein [Bacteriovorax sp. PP10]